MLSGEAIDKYESVESRQQNMANNKPNYSIFQFNPMMAAICFSRNHLFNYVTFNYFVTLNIYFI